MKYLKKYGISEQEIVDLKEKYNDGIIEFLTNEEIFVKQTLDFLKEKDFLIYPILENNIKVFLETTVALKNKIKKLEEKGLSKKAIQMILINEELYNQQ